MAEGENQGRTDLAGGPLPKPGVHTTLEKFAARAGPQAGGQQEHLLGQETPMALSVLHGTAKHAKHARPLPRFTQATAQGCCRKEP